MSYPVNRNIHRLPHIYEDDTFYFITARTVNKTKFFNTNKKKEIFFKELRGVLKRYSYLIYIWTFLDNHYHSIIKTKKGEDLGLFIRDLHSQSSKNLNKLENQKGRNVWYQYWDRCIRNEKDFFLHFNYIHHNLVKHKYVGTQKEVLDYKFCSYKQWVNKKGKEWMSDCFATYPIIDFTVEGDDF
jgi:putative transposase